MSKSIEERVEEFDKKFGDYSGSSVREMISRDKAREFLTTTLEELQQEKEEAVEAEREQMRWFAQAIVEVDKTERYEYSKNDCDRNALGELAGAGSRWATPKEMAQAKLRHLQSLTHPKEVSD